MSKIVWRLSHSTEGAKLSNQAIRNNYQQEVVCRSITECQLWLKGSSILRPSFDVQECQETQPGSSPLFRSPVVLSTVSKGESARFVSVTVRNVIETFFIGLRQLVCRGRIVRLSSSVRAINSKTLTETLCLLPWLKPKAWPLKGILQSWLWRGLPRLQ